MSDTLNISGVGSRVRHTVADGHGVIVAEGFDKWGAFWEIQWDANPDRTQCYPVGYHRIEPEGTSV